MDAKQIELCVPAEQSMMLVVRMATAGVMSRAGLTLDEMDDIKMAIDEACNMMMLQKPSCSGLYIVYEYDRQSVCVRIEGRDPVCKESSAKTDLNMQEVIRCILESMVDEVEMTEREDGSTKIVRLKKNIPDHRRGIA